ncbi:hypothetical protein B9Z55_016460 [Caenorhabditis nigoni]|uniref:Uncharacterized protein n=1 Tax=Caenorhabditis nigoni TaxID=1611254 RepID=A0A2G5T5B5_9PELO|nr:hypothetical protein B9Z55_016460 [Caenorhabditis nigoni]
MEEATVATEDPAVEAVVMEVEAADTEVEVADTEAVATEEDVVAMEADEADRRAVEDPAEDRLVDVFETSIGLPRTCSQSRRTSTTKMPPFHAVISTKSISGYQPIRSLWKAVVSHVQSSSSTKPHCQDRSTSFSMESSRSQLSFNRFLGQLP